MNLISKIMTTFITFTFYSILIFLKSVENKEFCDQNFKEKLLTGVMNYNETQFLVFRDQDVWSLEFDMDLKEFLEPKFIQLFPGNVFANYITSGMVFTKTPKCTEGGEEKCAKMLNMTIFFYSNSFKGSPIYQIFKLKPNGVFEKWGSPSGQSLDLPYNWRPEAYQELIFKRAHISGSAFLPKTMELFVISMDSLLILTFENTSSYGPPIDTYGNKLYSGTTGGFEMDGIPYFVINNKIDEYNRTTNGMLELYTSWDFFCNKRITTIENPSTDSDISKRFETSGASQETSKTTSKSSETVSTITTTTEKSLKLGSSSSVSTQTSIVTTVSDITTESKKSESSDTTQETSINPTEGEPEKSNNIILIIASIFAIIFMISFILTAIICCLESREEAKIIAES